MYEDNTFTGENNQNLNNGSGQNPGDLNQGQTGFGQGQSVLNGPSIFQNESVLTNQTVNQNSFGTQNTTQNTTTENRYFDHMSNTGYSAYNTYQSQGTVYTGEPAVKPKKEKKKPGFIRKTLSAAFIGLTFGALAAVGFYGVCRFTGVFQKADQIKEIMNKKPEDYQMVYQSAPSIKETEPQEYTGIASADVSGVVEEVMPAMVSILNVTVEESRFWGQTYTREYESSGSGIISMESGNELLIVTNHHVVENSNRLEVTFIDGEKVGAKIKGMDSDMDLAVISVSLKDLKSSTRAAIAVAKMGDSDSLKLGKPVVVIGNALGYGQSVTNGIISGLDRKLEDSEGSFIQTNAAVNPGNSGGALLNENGEVIGIVSNKIGGSIVEGMGYAIPISAANPIIAELMERPTRVEQVAADEMGYMGVTLQTIPEDYRTYFGIPQGVMVTEVSKGSAAEAAGIKYQDCISKIQGEKVNTAEDIMQIMKYYRVGDTVKVDIKRLVDGEYKDYQFEIVLGPRPEE